MKWLGLLALLGIVAVCRAADYNRCNQWGFENCTNTVEKDLDNLYYHYDKCSQVKSQPERLGQCRWKFMDGCPRDTRNRYDEWSYWSQTTQTSSEYYDMDIKYNEVLDRIQRDEKEYCSKKNKYDEKKYEGAESEKSHSDYYPCNPEMYMSCVKNIRDDVQYQKRGPSQHVCQEMREFNRRYSECQNEYSSGCYEGKTHNYWEMNRIGQEVINLVSDREREACTGGEHYYVMSAGVSKQGALVLLATSVVLLSLSIALG